MTVFLAGVSAAAAAFTATPSNNNNKSENQIRVIGVGLGRTGTLSLHEALKSLGYRPLHYVDPHHARDWYQVATGTEPVDTVINRMVQDGYDALSDNPVADIYLDLVQRYPHAKVVLTVRDTPQAFAASWKTLYRSIEVTEREFRWDFPTFFQWIPLFRYLKRIRCFMGTTHLGLPSCHFLKKWDQYSEGWLEEQYERHNRHVMEHVPPENLLVFNVREGWEPLCTFLEKEVPVDAPFPHVKINTAQGLLELRQTFVIVIWAWIPICLLLVLSMILICTGRCGGGRGARRKRKEE